jgi:hypothetical protein
LHHRKVRIVKSVRPRSSYQGSRDREAGYGKG